ncbi:RNA polymerase sigma-70 factor (TIGR02943 family) [Pedobacter sp. UYP30]|uniref:sigma-70 family RNA polymerase sigma factor n=1 Tax=Pedobacter sp. UYP30 TaxID=1756400 RepID=UPI0033976A0E
MDNMVEVKNKSDLTSIGANPKEWVCNYADFLYQFAFSRLNDDELAKDLVQETFLSALEKIGTFKARSSEKTWLTAILKYKIVDVYRSRSSAMQADNNQNKFFEQQDGHWKVEARPKEFGIEHSTALEDKEFQHILKYCLGKLPKLWHTVFAMKFIDDEQGGDICSKLNITSSNYWVIMHRAKLNLRACLQKNWL